MSREILTSRRVVSDDFRAYRPRDIARARRHESFGGAAIEMSEERDVTNNAGIRLANRSVLIFRAKKKHQQWRGPLPEHLWRIDIEHDLDDDEKAYPDCGELRWRILQ